MEITRTPSKDYMLKTAFWKAHEWKSFGLYYYVLLEGILPEPYFSHFALFSHGLYALLQEEVELEIVKKIGLVLDHFVAQAEAIYGRSYITYNFHLITHLCQCVQDWGCLWGSSTFIPEWFNGQLQSMVHGTQAPVEQMVSTFLVRSAVRDEVIDLMKDPLVIMSKKTVDLFKNLIHLSPSLLSARGVHIKNKKGISDGIFLLGSPSQMALDEKQMIAIQNMIVTMPLDSLVRNTLLNDVINSSFQAIRSTATCYPKLELKNGTVFTTSSYNRSPKRSNYCAFLDDGNFVLIHSIVVFPQLSEKCFVLGYVLGNQSKSHFVPTLIPSSDVDIEPLDVPIIPGQIVKLQGTSSELHAFDSLCIEKKCAIVMQNELSDSTIVVALANSIERD